MKNVIICIIVFLLPSLLFAQGGWTPEQLEEFEIKMEAWQLEIEQQMMKLEDSMDRIEEMMEEYSSREWDSADWNFDFMIPEIPETPEAPEMPEWGMEVEPGDDTTEVRIGNWMMIVNEDTLEGDSDVRIYREEEWEMDDDNQELKDVQTKFLLLDLGLNNYFQKGFVSTMPPGYEALEINPGKSWAVNLHVFNQKVNLIKHVFNLNYGVYFEFNSYKFSGDEVLLPDLDSVAFSESTVNYEKNKLSCDYVGIPIMFRIETNPHHPGKSFQISFGGFGEYLMGAHTKTKSSDEGKAKVRDDFNLNHFRYGFTGRVGYSWVNLFANYSVSELFETGTGPSLYPFTAGVGFEF